ncbi:MAG: DUF2339 domain-containing protein [Lysobacteraceae bacterium]
MKWIVVVVLAVLGGMLGDASRVMLGLLGGAGLGWALGSVLELRAKVDALERQLRCQEAGLPKRHLAESTVSSRPTALEPAVAESATVASVTAEPAVRPGPPPVPEWAKPKPATVAVEASTTPVNAAEVEPPQSWVAPPIAPSLPDRLVKALIGWFTEGNLPVKLGVLVLFAGVAAALKYAADQGYFTVSIEARLTSIAFAAIGGLWFGFRQRESRPAFGLSLQGGALGVLLLTVFAAFRYYALIPAPLALGLVVLLVAGSALLALLQNAAVLAWLGFLGGYLAPVLISTGSGNAVALFSYYAVLNAAVFAVAWRRNWHALNLLGFVFTFGIGALWGRQYYRPELFASIEPFLLLFSAFYLFIPVLTSLRAPADGRSVSTSLTFGLPLLAFPLQAALLDGERMPLAFSALVAAVIYALLAVWLIKRSAARLLGQSFAVLALGFATLSIPLAFSAEQTAMAWALEGVAAIWLGLRQDRRWPQIAGWALQALAGASFFFGQEVWLGLETGALARLGIATSISLALLALTALVTALLYERHAPQRITIWPWFLVGLAWWHVLGIHEAERLSLHGSWVLGWLLFASISIALAALLRRSLNWPRLSWAMLALWLPAPLLVPLTAWDLRSPLADLGGLAWLAWGLSSSFGLSRLRAPAARLTGLAHILVLSTIVLLFAFEFAIRLDRDAELGDAWVIVATIAPLLLLSWGLWRRPQWFAWPLQEHFIRYARYWHGLACAGILFALCVIWMLPGSTAPLSYLPVLNPLDLTQGLILLALWRAWTGLGRGAKVVLASAAFVSLTQSTLRAVYHWSGAVWGPSLLDTASAQAALTVVWCLLGVTAWVAGSRLQRYALWLPGAILMGVVLLKMLLVDRHYLGDLAGVIAVLTVGLLLVGVGYIAPSPPRRISEESVP